MTPDDLKKAPKLFCENIKIGHSPEFFVMGFSSGSQAHIFSLTPQHAKRFLQYLSYEIGEYEKEHKVIDATWVPHVVSPVQRANPPTDAS
jgi:hypothetical protein